MAIPTTIDGYSETYAVKTKGWMGIMHPVHFGIGDPAQNNNTIAEVYGEEGNLTACLWNQQSVDPSTSYHAQFADPTEAAQWVVNEYERRTIENDWR